MVLTDDELQRAEENILIILRNSTSPYHPGQLLKDLKEEGFSEYLTRAAIWYLIDRDKVELTSDRKLEPYRTKDHEYA